MSDSFQSIYHVLVIEDDRAMQDAISRALPKEIFAVPALSASEARRYLGDRTFDLILLDLTLPDEDGLKLCSWIRSEDRFADIPLMLITGRVGTEDKVMAFSLGADDYLVKPIEPREFRARILSKLKRSHQKRERGQIYSTGNLKFLIPTHKVFVAENGSSQPIDVTPLEFRLLLAFAQNEERIFSRDQLISKIWGEEISVLDRTVDSHISDLRKKLKSASHAIKAVRGLGYRFVRVTKDTAKKSA